VKYHPDIAKRIVRGIQVLAESIDVIGSNPTATLDQIESVRRDIRALLGTITLMPENGQLWAHPNAKGPTEVRPLEGLRINSPESGSGGVICSVPTVRQRVHLK
jgi:hypothetical protein